VRLYVMARNAEVSVYMPPTAAADLEQNAKEQGYATTSAYVRSQLEECDDE